MRTEGSEDEAGWHIGLRRERPTNDRCLGAARHNLLVDGGDKLADRRGTRRRVHVELARHALGEQLGGEGADLHHWFEDGESGGRDAFDPSGRL